MEFRVLGPVRALQDGQDLALGRRRERLVLGLLLLEGGRLITNERLADLVWDGDPPVRALDQIKVAVSRLRSCLSTVEEVAIRSHGHGYVIDVEPAAVDAYCFRSEVEQALATVDLGVRVEALRRALGRWYGPLLADVADAGLRSRIGLSLEQLQLTALAARFDAQMRLDGPQVVIPDLVDLVVAHPVHERFVVLLMRALFDAGRPADALRVYHELSARLANDLGVDPGPHARSLFAEILQADRGPRPREMHSRQPTDGTDPKPIPAPPPAPPPPAQLPLDIATFVGRTSDLRTLDGWGAGSIGVVVGAPGSGKSTLVNRWAHRNAGHWPQGQLWLDLRGYSPGRPLSTEAAITRLLHGLGLEPHSVPPDLDDAISKYRTMVAGRRMLIVLDNAGTADQVRPLLPGGSTCTIIVTSRNRLTDLVARSGACRLTLGGMLLDDATALVQRIAGSVWDDTDPETTEALARACDYLPLALCLSAAHLAEHPERRVGDEVAMIRNGMLLRHGADPDDSSPIRAAFDQSYTSLHGSHQAMFRAFGLHPAPTLDVGAAAALGGIGYTEARRRMAVLAQAHLISEPAPARFVMHDLLRDYARERSMSDPGRSAAVDRLYRYYLGAASRCVAAAGFAPRPASDGVNATPAGLADAAIASTWLDAELPALVGLAIEATTQTAHYVVDLGSVLPQWLLRRGYYGATTDFYRAVLAASRLIDNSVGEAGALRQLGTVAWRQGRLDAAHDLFVESLGVLDAAGEDTGRAQVYNSLGGSMMRRGSNVEALDYFGKAVAAHEAAGDRLAAAGTTSNIGILCWRIGWFDEAYVRYQAALDTFVAVGDEVSAAKVRGNMGNVDVVVGRYAQARHMHEHSLAMFTRINEPAALATCLVGLAQTLIYCAEYELARERLDEAERLFQELDDRSGQGQVLEFRGLLNYRTGDATRAVTDYREAVAIFNTIGEPAREAHSLAGLSAAEQAGDNSVEAIANASRSLRLAESIGDRWAVPRARAALGHAYVETGEVAYGRELLEAAYREFAEFSKPQAAEIRSILDDGAPA